MEAHFFRHLIVELTPELRSSKVEKVYEPLEGVWTLKLSRRGNLLCIVGPRENGLCLSPDKPENPPSPSARARWWRKRLHNRRILDVVSHWPERQVALALSEGEGRYLRISLSSGLELSDELPAGFGEDPEWPGLDAITNTPDIFRTFPHISPLLRKTLANQSREEAHRLLRFLQQDTPEAFYHSFSGTEREMVSIWPLRFSEGEGWREEVFPRANEAALSFCWRLLKRREARIRQPSVSPHRTKKRLRRKLQQVAEDEQRLRNMASLQDTALLLQMNLHRIDPSEKRGQAVVFDSSGNATELELDQQLTVLQNMERMFARARKGRRGLQHVERRRQELERELRSLESSEQPGSGPGLPEKAPGRSPARQARSASRWQDLKVHVFRSSDGFLMVRGKNKRSNHRLLSQAARPFDLWFHAENGPGAHVILQRDVEGQEVPRRSLEQAAVLAALSSHQSRAAKATVMCARVKDVRTIKGAPLGEVRVDSVQESLVVEVDPRLEDTLRIEGG